MRVYCSAIIKVFWGSLGLHNGHNILLLNDSDSNSVPLSPQNTGYVRRIEIRQ